MDVFRSEHTSNMNKFWYLSLSAVSLAVLANPIAAQAFTIAAPGTEGFNVVANGGTVTASYDGSTAGYSNDLYLMLDALGNPGNDGITTNDRLLFNNQNLLSQTPKVLGSFANGTVLSFSPLLSLCER